MRKIGIDLDGTITDAPWFFAALTHGLSVQGWEIHIITYRSPKDKMETRALLREYGVKYDVLHMADLNQPPPPEWKKSIVEENGIEVMIEDDPDNLAALPHQVTRLWICNPEIIDLDLCSRELKKSFK